VAARPNRIPVLATPISHVYVEWAVLDWLM